MSLRACPSFPSSLAALLVPALLAACGGNVVVTGGGEGANGGSGGSGGNGGTPTITTDDCPPGLTQCGAACVNVTSDPENCGKCFNSCQGGTCQGGQCVIAPGCPPNLTDCDGSCVDTATDPVHCGGCFLNCPFGSSCVGGDCVAQCFCNAICEYTDLGSVVPQSATLGLASANFVFDVACAPPGDWPDLSFLWTAPYKGAFTFDTFGSEDTAMQIMSPECTLYACNDDAAPGGASQVTLELSAGQKVLIVVDAIDSAGSVTLNINEQEQCATCGEYISGENFEDPLCPDSDVLYNDLVSCICEGACGMVCFEACGGGDFTQECQDCIFDTVNGCGNQFNECANDI